MVGVGAIKTMKLTTPMRQDIDPLNKILIDETPAKAMQNPPRCLIKAHGFDGDEKDDFLERLKPYLWYLYWFPGCAANYIWANDVMQKETCNRELDCHLYITF